MNITIDINIRASEDITNSILTLAAVFHNTVPIFDKSPNVIEIKEITLKDVQDTLFSLSEGGKREEVKALIKKFGVTKLTDIPKEKYEQLLSEASFIN